MLKKMLIGSFLVIMIGAIVVGGISLFSRSEDAHAWQGRGRDDQDVVAQGAEQGGQGRGRGSQVIETDGGQGRGRGSQQADANAGQGRGQGSQQADANAGQGRGQGGQGPGANAGTDEAVSGGGYGRGQGQGSSQPSRAEPQAETADWRTLEGTVVETEELVIETADGETVQIGLGPSHYRESQGFDLQVGDSVSVSGYFEDGEFKAAQVVKPDTGESIVLRDTSGRPMWSGRGNRKTDLTDIDADRNTAVDRDALNEALQTTAVGELDAVEVAGLLYMREEEKLARDVYLTLYEKWEMPIFQNIANSESTHMEAIETLIDRYNLEDPAAGKDAGVFTDQTLQGLYDQLVAEGSQSL